MSMTGLSDDATRLPVGTVTFLRTDVEGSMGLARQSGSAWDEMNARHLAIIRAAVSAHEGHVVRTEGDAVFAAFGEAGAALRGAVDAQRALAAETWPAGLDLRVRMGLHSGEAHLAGDDYGGFDVSRAARVAAAGHGGQVLVSEATTALIADQLPPGVTLRDLGEHRLKDVPRPVRIAQVCVDGLPSEFPPLRGSAVTGDLPDRVTSFVGREREVDAIRELLSGDARLVTLTGPAGIGKSSVAIEAARVSAPAFPDGVWFVPLADVTDREEVTAAVAHGVGLHDGPERTAAAALLPYIAERRMLIVLDNMEQVIGAAEDIARLVRSSPGSRVLVTSRAPLHIGGEHELPLAPLTDGAVALFEDRARAVRPAWDPGPDRATVAEICRLLDWLPLGIELAASRISMLSPVAIRDRLAARLPLPGPGPRDAPARQQTLDGAVAWSHDLLDPAGRSLLHELAVFDDGFEPDQVAAVVDPADGSPGVDTLDALIDLADRSLIVADPAGDGRPRFRMLRTIQSFALDRLVADGREAAVRRRHAEAYIALITEATAELNTSRHVAWIDRIDPEMGNLRTAIDAAMAAADGELALRLLGPMWRFWQAFGRTSEGRLLTESALAMPSAPRDGAIRAWAAAAAGNLAYWQSDSPSARRWYEEQLRVAQEADDKPCIADAMFNLGHVAFIDEEDKGHQEAHMREVVARYREIGDDRGAARAGVSRGLLAFLAGREEEAAAHLQASLEEFERLDDLQYIAVVDAVLGWLAFMKGDMPRAARLTADNIRATWGMRDLATTTISLHTGLMMAVMIGRFEEAAVIDGAFDAGCERYGVRPPADLEHFIQDFDPVGQTRQALGEEAYAAAYARGRLLDTEASVQLVIAMAEAVERGSAA
jgi:predicted ATPase/class 3 adenylate cyclase